MNEDWTCIALIYEYNMIVDIVIEVGSNCAILELSWDYQGLDSNNQLENNQWITSLVNKLGIKQF